ncbi:MAG: hypothetical protein JW993_18065 [Sedimentisphaerales bacterium]|nr:hypothetical protein [Sedimentisphaerales bacterium]
MKKTNRTVWWIVMLALLAVASIMLDGLRQPPRQIVPGFTALKMVGIVAAIGVCANLILLCIRSHFARQRKPGAEAEMLGRVVRLVAALEENLRRNPEHTVSRLGYSLCVFI